jgi:hypothetical protein
MKTLLAGLILTLAALGPAEQLIAQSPGLPNEGSRLEYDGKRGRALIIDILCNVFQMGFIPILLAINFERGTRQLGC